MSHSETGQSAVRRFVDIIGEERLSHGSWMVDQPRLGTHGNEAYHVGKEAFIIATLFPQEVCWSPYLPDSRQGVAYQSGARVECADLQDVVRRCRS